MEMSIIGYIPTVGVYNLGYSVSFTDYIYIYIIYIYIYIHYYLYSDPTCTPSFGLGAEFETLNTT